MDVNKEYAQYDDAGMEQDEVAYPETNSQKASTDQLANGNKPGEEQPKRYAFVGNPAKSGMDQ
jgi:hypothetical protein